MSESLDDGLLFAEYVLSDRGRRSARWLRAHHNRYAGKRAFIIGNGPSLRSMDLTPLENEFTFGLNRIYLKFPDMGFATTFLLASEQNVIEQFGADMAKSDSQVLLSHRFAKNVTLPAATLTFLSRRSRVFGTDPLFWGFHDGNTITYTAMQMAFYFGFHEVILIGVDHSFKFEGEPGAVVVSRADDPNHFDPSYFGDGIVWKLPNLPMSEVSYHMARHHYERNGRRILDATVGGQLTVFPKADWEGIVTRGPASGPSNP